ncbi:hypothetical protein V1277_006286 [Bradyrhizobium sp. AZCC 1588]|uniref:hypothetical protein n=1 Tax=unclassified Bradyrhizobium TaxID=2631580 RepID=UPI002FF1F108
MAITRTPPLEERIEKLRADIDAFIDTRIAKEAKDCPGVPAVMLRQMATSGSGGCQCAAYLKLKQQEEERAA